MSEIGVHEAEKHLSRLLRRSRGRRQPREFGFDRDVLIVPENFDAPLGDETQDEFER